MLPKNQLMVRFEWGKYGIMGLCAMIEKWVEKAVTALFGDFDKFLTNILSLSQDPAGHQQH
jgi:hypothetical protein